MDGSRNQITIVCVGEHNDVSWVNGSPIVPNSEKDRVTGLTHYLVKSMPDDPEIEIDNFVVRLSASENEKGHVSPIMAAVTSEPLVPASGDLLDEIMSDPRYQIEEWLSKNCIRNPAPEKFQKCLGSALLTTNPDKTEGNLKWDNQVEAFSDLNSSTAVNAKFPTSIHGSSALANFWEAFEALNLRDTISQIDTSALPSALDLRVIPKKAISRYLEAFHVLLDEIDPNTRGSAWIAFPFSTILFDPEAGAFRGTLLSPLHPLRMAWNWSAQKSSDKLSTDSPYQSVASSSCAFSMEIASLLWGHRCPAMKTILL